MPGAAEASSPKYASNSGALSLINLQEEPQRYNFEAERISADLDALVLDNYRIFVENMTCSVRLQNEENALTLALQSLKQELTSLSADAKSLRSSLSTFLTAYSKNKKTLQQHMKLIELLEVPQLVDACIRNTFYDEALDLASFVFGLAQRSVVAMETKAKAKGAKGDEVSVGQVSATPPTAHSGVTVIQGIAGEVTQLLVVLRAYLLTEVMAETSGTTAAAAAAGTGAGNSANSPTPAGEQLNNANGSSSSGAASGNSSSMLPLGRQLELIGIVRKIDTLLRERTVFQQMHSPENSNSDDTSNASQLSDSLKRDMGAASEVELRVSYLRARGRWLDRRISEQFEGIDATSGGNAAGAGAKKGAGAEEQRHSSSAYQLVTELLDVTRTSLYTIILHYNALFDDSESNSTPSGSCSTPGPGVAGAVVSEGGLVLTVWVSDQLKRVMWAVESCLAVNYRGGGGHAASVGGGMGALPGHWSNTLAACSAAASSAGESLDGTAVRALLEQCLYLTHRMAQVGCDTQPEVVDLFSRCIHRQLSTQWHTALVQFKSVVATERITLEPTSASGHAREQIAPLYWDQRSRVSGTSATTASASTSSSPSTGAASLTLHFGMTTLPPLHRVTAFPPLAFVLNALLHGFNFIKGCNLSCLRGMLFGEVSAVLVDVCNAVVRIASDLRGRGAKYLSASSSSEGSSNTPTSSAQHMDVAYAAIIAQEMVPYVLFAFERLYDFDEKDGSSRKVSLPVESLLQVTAAAKATRGAGSSIGGKVSVSLSADSLAVLAQCWGIFDAAKLLPSAPTPAPAPAAPAPAAAEAPPAGPAKKLAKD